MLIKAHKCEEEEWLIRCKEMKPQQDFYTPQKLDLPGIRKGENSKQSMLSKRIKNDKDKNE